jgi:hypothetical protein
MYSLEASTDQVSRNIISFLSRQMVTFLFLARVHGSVYPPHPKHILQKKIMDLCTYLVCLLFCVFPQQAPDLPFLIRPCSVGPGLPGSRSNPRGSTQQGSIRARDETYVRF